MDKLHSNPGWARSNNSFFATGEAAPVLAGISDTGGGDDVVRVSRLAQPGVGRWLAILAVGGFGRRELFPYSDVDVLLLVERESETVV